MYSKEQKVNFNGVGGKDLFLGKVTEKEGEWEVLVKQTEWKRELNGVN